ncbi:zf-HC2 domain-containing protein [Paenibacillus turicensis]|uniref:anti-sigma factor family protein n=1 Tax=Paenibacillus turicensis TaxID=160487 RepID=UPI003D2886BB
MGCPEVIEEWMNLYVDHALDDEEEKLLLQHVQSCPDCAEKFTLLKELSARLEQLPMATPSFDLVDAILPQLQAIDQRRNEEASTVIPMVRDKVNQTSKRSRIFRTGVLGTAVAAVIFGLFVYNHENNNMQDADGQIEQQVAFVEENSSLNSNSQNSENKQLVEAEQNNNKVSSNEDRPVDTKPLEDQATSDQKSVTKNNPQQPQKDQAKQPSNSDVDKKGKSPTVKPEKQNKDVQSSPKNQDASRGAGTGEVESSNQDEGIVMHENNDMPEKLEFFNGDTSIGMGMTSNISQWVSPDGLYSVELNDAHVYLYKISSESNKTLLMDQAIEGAWVDGAWSQDEQNKLTFSYRTEIDGTIKSSLIDPKVLEKNK